MTRNSLAKRSNASDSGDQVRVGAHRVEAHETEREAVRDHRQHDQRLNPLALEVGAIGRRLRRQLVDPRHVAHALERDALREPGQLVAHHDVLQLAAQGLDAEGAPLVGVVDVLAVGAEQEDVAAVGADEAADARQRVLDAVVDAAAGQPDELRRQLGHQLLEAQAVLELLLDGVALGDVLRGAHDAHRDPGGVAVDAAQRSPSSECRRRAP